MKQIRKNNVVAIETRKNLFVLAQRIGNGTFVFFNCFNKNIQQFNDIKLENADILCCITPVKPFLQKSNIIKLENNPLLNIQDYHKRERLSFELNCSREKYKIYKDTKDEMELLHYKGDLRLVNWKYETIKNLDKNTDKNIIDNYQLDTLGMYGELNEKLYLSYKYGKFVEPLKELVMGETLPIEYKTYFLICSQKITEDEWKKLT